MDNLDILPVSGFRIGTAAAGIRRAGRDDLMVAEMAEGSSCAAVFTRNAFAAAPVRLAREYLQSATPRYLLVNSGIANAGTGAAGVEHAKQTCALLAECANCRPEQVLPFSTGVIGEYLPVERFKPAIPAAVGSLAEDAWLRGVKAIMTTDTRPKLASRRMELGSRTVNITGMAKGAGMIRPDMATMLSFIACDAAIPCSALQRSLQAGVGVSFNRITVDGDTSTNDACVLAATGGSGVELTPRDSAWEHWERMLQEVMVELAKAVVADGEGATKLVTIHVAGGSSVKECEQVAFTVAHSPLVKTALFAADANWGRILAAVGRAGLIDLAIESVACDISGAPVARYGQRAADYDENRVAKLLAQDEVTININLERGEHEVDVWTCDLSYDYVRINAEYRS